MIRITWCAMALAVALSAPAGAQQSELSTLREELKRLQQRIDDLEKRQEAPTKAAVPAPAAARSSEAAFNPGISLILQGTFASSSQDPDDYRISGFAPSGGEVQPPRRGLSLAESELVVGGNIDPHYRGYFVAALTPENEVEVEEAYIQTLSLGRGFTLKAGRFLSGIGYQNELHQHAWDFQDAPLVYKAFVGGRLNDDGVQLRWVAPAELFLELGAELGRARSFPGSDTPKNGAGARSLFGRVGGDLGEAAWRAGLSLVRTSPRNRSFTDLDSFGNPVSQAFSGKSRLWVADAVVKWPRFKLQGEYFRRNEQGLLGYDDTAQAAPQFGAALSGGYASRQSGWYAQAVYEFMPRWRAGYRYDRLSHGNVENALAAGGAGPAAADFPLLLTAHDPARSTFMVDWSPTEFSRWRVQLASDRSRAGITDRQALIQYIMSLGAHGAHRF
jgi:hypothetical protein